MILSGNRNLSLTDDDIIIKTHQADKSTLEYDIYKQYMVSILTSLSYCYIELRNYSEAEKCLLEAQLLIEESNPMIFFRLAQTRIYNRCSREEDWAKALSDLNKAKRLNDVITNKSSEDTLLKQLINKEIENINLLLHNFEQETNFRNTSK